nr:hypothetical protein [Nonomuraea sp. PA05]
MAGQRAGRRDLAEEAALVAFGQQHPVVDLERHLTADGRLQGEVDHAEAALAQHALDLVTRDR